MKKRRKEEDRVDEVILKLVHSRCDSMEKLRKRSESLDAEIQDVHNFKDFYQFTFNFAKNPGQKGLGEHATHSVISVCRHCILLCRS